MHPNLNKGLVVVCTALLAVPATPQSTDRQPRETDIVERTGRRLAQLDVTVSGPDETISSLSAEDFELNIAGRVIDSFIVDRACRVEQTEVAVQQEEGFKEPIGTTTTSRAVPAAVAPRPTYLFYFDQHHLTGLGRQNSLDTARSVGDRLVRDGARAMIVSAGKSIETVLPFTEDRNLFQDALDLLERDNDQWDPYAYQEESRVEEVLRELRDGDIQKAQGTARRLQREERYRTDKALRLFEITIARLADLDQPKAVLYFADSMRKNAGAHYASYFPRGSGNPDWTLERIESDGFVANNAFDRVVEAAAANGVRLYTVQGEGMLAPSMTLSRSNSTAQAQPSANTRRRVEAQNSLVGLARETGGQAFLHGAPGKKIATQILEDLSCMYLISFDVSELPEDRPLSVTLRSTREGVKTSTRGQIVVASEENQKTARLLAAFTGIVPDVDGLELEGVVIPTGFEDGKYTALVQIRAPSLPLPSAAWELGASLVTRGRVREDVSGRIEVDRPSVPVIFEVEMTFGPGPFELVMVAHEQTTDQIARAELQGDWPDPDDAEVTLGPLALVQPADGAFLRNGQVRRSGSLGRTTAEAVEPGLPAAVIGLVCRDKSKRTKKAGLVVERRLVGASEAPFTNLTLSENNIRCIQLRDIIRANTMTEGSFIYEVRVVNKLDEELTASTLEFAAIGTELPDDGL